MGTAERSSAYESVADFYAGKSVFITGVTGFLGKVSLVYYFNLEKSFVC